MGADRTGKSDALPTELSVLSQRVVQMGAFPIFLVYSFPYALTAEHEGHYEPRCEKTGLRGF